MRMNLAALVIFAPLLLVSCSGLPFFKDERASAQDQGRAEAVLQTIEYDGESLRGRLLITAIGGPLRLDKRLIETAYLTTESVSDCVTGTSLSFIVMDAYAKPPSDADILLLKPGYWYGKDVRVPLFAKSADSMVSPACIEVKFAFRDLDGNTLVPLVVRAERSQPSPAKQLDSTDAGVSADAGGDWGR